MTVSALRTVVVRGPPYGYGTLRRALRWPTAQPSDNLDYSLDLTVLLADAGDSIASASLSVAPSGEGELQPADLSVQGSVITAQLSGGVAGRDYQAQVIAASAAGRTIAYLVGLMIDPALATYPLPAPPNAGFGTPITWTSGVTASGISFVSVLTGLTATGTTQDTAYLLGAATCVFATVPAGAGAILPGGIISGTCAVSNFGANPLLIYPPVGAQIGNLAVNVPVTIVPDQTARFSTQSPTTEWYAS